MADSNKTLLWLCGHPCSGKTWMGDYLESRGFKHVDGDAHAQLAGECEESKKLWKGLEACFHMMQAQKPVPEEMWKPYYEDAVHRVKDALKDHDKVVFTFALFDCFGEKEYIVEDELTLRQLLN